MDQELDPQKALAGLAVLTAIPIVLFALWGDYFGRYLLARSKEEKDFEPATEIYRVRLTGLFALLAQMMLFFGSADIRKIYPYKTNLLFLGALVIQMIMQTWTERRLAPKMADGRPTVEPLGVVFRAFIWSVFGGVLYVGVMIASLYFFGAISVLLKATGALAVGLMAMGAVVGVVAGLGIGFALGPFQLRRMLPTYAMESSSLREMVESCFIRAGVQVPSIWIVGHQGPAQVGMPQFSNAMIAGFQSGRGLFRPGLFLARPLLDSLSPEELQAVVFHEISHIRLSHLKKRFIYSSGMILGTSLVAGLGIISTHVLMPGGELNGVFAFAVMLAAFMTTFRSLVRQNRFHEIEADIEAVRVGATVEGLCEALRKLDRLNHIEASMPGQRSPTLSGSGHPATEERIKIIRTFYASRDQASSDSGKAA